jgi:hypothetical protein
LLIFFSTRQLSLLLLFPDQGLARPQLQARRCTREEGLVNAAKYTLSEMLLSKRVVLSFTCFRGEAVNKAQYTLSDMLLQRFFAKDRSQFFLLVFATPFSLILFLRPILSLSSCRNPFGR